MPWFWTTVKKSFKNPYIRIPKRVIEVIGDGAKPLYVIVTDSKDEYEELMKCLGERR
ncbi:MAG: hypothetical protein GXO07_06875 [Crenarchaeota archaeon]|nr:hypothetical protein [Thermoproteota archaeon]